MFFSIVLPLNMRFIGNILSQTFRMWKCLVNNGWTVDPFKFHYSVDKINVIRRSELSRVLKHSMFLLISELKASLRSVHFPRVLRLPKMICDSKKIELRICSVVSHYFSATVKWLIFLWRKYFSSASFSIFLLQALFH